MAEVAAVAVGAAGAVRGGEHAAELGLVPRVTDHRAKLTEPMSELAPCTVRTIAHLAPLVAQLGLHCSLVEHIELHFSTGFLPCFSVAALRSTEKN